MISMDSRFFAPSGDIFPGGPSTWHIVDADQRRLISVTADEEQDSEDIAIDSFRRYIDSLGPEVYRIRISREGELLSTSSAVEDDYTRCVHYPPVSDLKFAKVETIQRSELEELDRLGPDVDLVAYPALSSTAQKKVVFKYYYLSQFMGRIWHEMSLWMRLPPHPSIVPFDRVVVDELASRAVGFTTIYIPGGTLEENQSRVFKLKWLEQLIAVVDDLNLKYGIAHQDISARNLVVNHATDTLMLFDFNFSARIGTEAYSENRNDLKGVAHTMLEIITRNNDLRRVPHEEQEEGIINKEWVKHPDTALDHPVSAYRSMLLDWTKKRQEGPQIATYTEAPEYIDWPLMAEPSPKVFEVPGLNGTTSSFSAVCYDERRSIMKKNGDLILKWERPSKKQLKDSYRLLATGEIVHGTGERGSD